MMNDQPFRRIGLAIGAFLAIFGLTKSIGGVEQIIACIGAAILGFCLPSVSKK